MDIHLITCELMCPEQGASKLHEAIMAYRGYEVFEFCWLLKTNASDIEVHDRLCQYIGPDDKLTVATIARVMK